MPDVVYHYCGVEAFNEILSSRILRLSNVYLMNDYEEHGRLIDRANSLILGPNTDDSTGWHKALSEPFPWNRTPYVGCFSSERDLLSQWRAYSDHGEGFAIGFNTDYLKLRLKEYHSASQAMLHFDRVEYDEETQDSKLKKLLEGHGVRIECDNDSISECDQVKLKALATKCMIWKYACFCKNPTFREECELRLAFLPVVKLTDDGGLAYEKVISRPKFVVRDGAIVPVFEFDFAHPVDGCLPIKEIGLGPKNRAGHRDYRECLEFFLRDRQYDVDQIDVYTSEATYR